MTLPTTPGSSMSLNADIADEFNDSDPNILSSEFRTAVGKSAGQTISFSDFSGVSNIKTSNLGLVLTTYDHTVTDPSDADCIMTFNSNGSFTVTKTGGTETGDYLLIRRGGIGSNYWIKWNTPSGTNPSSAMTENTYYQLSSARSINIARTTIGTNTTGTTTITIARDNSGTGAQTWVGTLSAIVESGL